MRGIGSRIRGIASFGAAVVALSLAGCGLQPPAPDPEAPEPVVVEEPAPVLPEPDPVPLPEPPKLPPVAIVITSQQPAYADVAAELANRFDDYDIYDLSDRSRPPISVLRIINDSGSGAVVAIGLRAAQSSVAMSDAPVVFSQVFNHRDHNLLSDNSRGVAALAPLDAQLGAWKSLDPTMVRVGAIIGEGHEDLIAEAQRAAARHNIDLRIRIAQSDQETMYLFRRMIRDIDGFWLFPDNRILSARVLRQMLDEANRLRVPVAVPNESMLEMGGTVSLGTVAADIADKIVKVIREIQAGKIASTAPITPLSEIRVTTHESVRVADR